jgi:hypothetical protein
MSLVWDLIPITQEIKFSMAMIGDQCSFCPTS